MNSVATGSIVALLLQAATIIGALTAAVIGWRKLKVDVKTAAKDEAAVWLQDNARLRQQIAENDARCKQEMAEKDKRIGDLERSNIKLEEQGSRYRGEIDGLQANVEWLRGEADYWRQRVRDHG